MKIIHGSLSALLSDVKEHGKVDGVRVAAVMQSTTEGPGLPRYTSWVIVSAHVDWEKWAEWRLVVGHSAGRSTAWPLVGTRWQPAVPMIGSRMSGRWAALAVVSWCDLAISRARQSVAPSERS